ncbi:hypothetical protein L6255_01850 [Candidatus Parcubacteria bacterium]|nr:hypothetical protein [Patescibacteria group bacterium]MBU4381117.1 hypothetical protein [Patescibacteria group bacterium]MCG2689160.1 hypothetical protein [Candidatus Parcubacteria bacterium]
MAIFSPWKTIYTTVSPVSGDIRVEQKDNYTRLVVTGYVQSVSLNYPNIESTVWGNIVTCARTIVPNAKTALILGIAGGTVPALLKQTNPALEITGVDYDEIVTSTGSKFLHFPNPSHPPNSPYPPKVVVMDAYEFVLKTTNSYDLVVVDLYTGGSYDLRFASDQFLGALPKLVELNGAVIINRIFTGNIANQTSEFSNNLKKYFKQVTCKRVRTKFYETSFNFLFICQ